MSNYSVLGASSCRRNYFFKFFTNVVGKVQGRLSINDKWFKEGFIVLSDDEEKKINVAHELLRSVLENRQGEWERMKLTEPSLVKKQS